MKNNNAKALATAPNNGSDHNTLKVQKDPGQSDAAQIAKMALGSVAGNALTARTFAAGTFGKLDITECVVMLK